MSLMEVIGFINTVKIRKERKLKKIIDRMTELKPLKALAVDSFILCNPVYERVTLYLNRKLCHTSGAIMTNYGN